jgi:hypothetical protein
MGKFRQLGKVLMLGALAHSRWELEMSKNILGSRKRLFVLGLLTLPVILGGFAFANEITNVLPEVLGGKKAYSPAFYSIDIFIVSILIGMGAGLITGCIGAGGGFIIAPALMSAGIRGIMAVGTDLFHIFAKAIMGSVIHRKLGNVNVGLAVVFLIGAIIGATVGGVINRTLYEINPVLSDAFISTVYSLMLGFLGAYAMTDFLRARKKGGGGGDAHGGKVEGAELGNVPQKLQAMKLPPMVKFDGDLVPGGRSRRRRISDIPHFCIWPGGLFHDDRRHGYLSDRVYRRFRRHQSVCDLRFHFLYAGHGDVIGISGGDSDRCSSDEGGARYYHPWILCHGGPGRICQPDLRASGQTRGNGCDPHIQRYRCCLGNHRNLGLFCGHRRILRLGHRNVS